MKFGVVPPQRPNRIGAAAAGGAFKLLNHRRKTLLLAKRAVCWQEVAKIPRAVSCPHSQASPRHRAKMRQPIKNTDRKSTRLNSSHVVISYAVFCLKKKNKTL